MIAIREALRRWERRNLQRPEALLNMCMGKCACCGEEPMTVHYIGRHPFAGFAVGERCATRVAVL